MSPTFWSQQHLPYVNNGDVIALRLVIDIYITVPQVILQTRPLTYNIRQIETYIPKFIHTTQPCIYAKTGSANIFI